MGVRGTSALEQLALVDRVLGLALAALDGVGRHQAQVHAQAQDLLDGALDSLLQGLDLADLVGDELWQELDLDLERCLLYTSRWV